jgi:hypothetical protein
MQKLSNRVSTLKTTIARSRQCPKAGSRYAIARDGSPQPARQLVIAAETLC